MKRQTIKALIVTLLFAFNFSISKSQTAITADTIGNTCEGENVSDILFRICDSTIIQLKSDNGSVRVNTNLEITNGSLHADSINTRILTGNDSIHFKGIAIFDSIKIRNGFIYTDSIRARVIHVGDSSIIIGSGGLIGNQTLGPSNVIATTNTGLPPTQTLSLQPNNGIITFTRPTGTPGQITFDLKQNSGTLPANASEIISNSPLYMDPMS